MSYNTDSLQTAGKITVYTTFVGIAIFFVVFIFNLGETTIKQAVAQDSATTTIQVLNTPPQWTASSTELIESSTTTPTDAGNTVTWVAVGTDSNAERYYLLICSTATAPTASSSAAPNCADGVQWAVSASTTSGEQATAATTTDVGWAEINVWYGWICDGNSATPRCNASYSQGVHATNSSPFEVNHRPTFTVFVDDSPKDPGQLVTFTSTSSDTDVSGVADTVFLTVCATSGFNTTTNACTGTTLATSTAQVAADATASYTIVIPTQDTTYGAFGYVTDNHGFEASGGSQDTNSTVTVSNVAPSLSTSTISLNGGSDIVLTVEENETTGFTLDFSISDNNSCDAFGGVSNDEIIDFEVSIYRSGIGSTTCAFDASDYNANYCYTTGVATTTWNLSCTASTTACTGSSDLDTAWDCTFPLWYIADPTDGVQGSSTEYGNENWLAQVRGVDDDYATGSPAQTSIGVNVNSLLAFTLDTLEIDYGALEPGNETPLLVSTTTLLATGNVGLDTDVEGESMCTTYTDSTLCPNSATSTIPESEQVFATGTVTYAEGIALSSTTPQEIEINVPKSDSTSTPTSSDAFWGIAVPASITYSGDYFGENLFTAKVGESVDW